MKFLGMMLGYVIGFIILDILFFLINKAQRWVSKKCSKTIDGVEFNAWEQRFIVSLRGHVERKGLEEFDVRIATDYDDIDINKIIKYINSHDDINFNIESIEHVVDKYTNHTSNVPVHHTSQIYHVKFCKSYNIL